MILGRIKQFIDEKRLTIASFERSVGMSNNSFGKSLKAGGAIGSDKLENILRIYPEINPSWLLTGEGSMLQSAPEQQASAAPEESCLGKFAPASRSVDRPSASAPDTSVIMHLLKQVERKDDEIRTLHHQLRQKDAECATLRAQLAMLQQQPSEPQPHTLLNEVGV